MKSQFNTPPKHNCTSRLAATSYDAMCHCRGLLDHPIQLQHPHNGFLTDSSMIYIIDDNLKFESLNIDSCEFKLIKGKLEITDSLKERLVYVDRKRVYIHTYIFLTFIYTYTIIIKSHLSFFVLFFNFFLTSCVIDD